MILEFSFSSVSDNKILENILHNILHKIICKYPIQGSLVYEKQSSFLYIQGEEEVLKTFSDTLSNTLPLSLFFSLVKVKVVENFPTSSSLPNCEANIPFTHSMLQEVLDTKSKNYFNPFIKVGFGKELGIKPPLIFKTKDESIKASKSQDYFTLIQKTALHVKSGKSLQINTKNGLKILKKLDTTSFQELQKSSFYIIPCDLSVVQKAFIATQDEIYALASLEKPLLNLRVNMIYKNKNILPTNWADVKISDSLLLFLLTKELFAQGVEFVSMEDKIKGKEAKGSLTHAQQKECEPLRVNVLENKAIVLLSANEFEPTKKAPSFKDKSHELFTSILYEHNLFEQKSSCFYLSKKYDDKVMTYSKKLGLIELISIEIPASIKELIEQIKNTDEGGAKLIENYEKENANILKHALHVKVPQNSPKSFYTLLGIVGVLLGFGSDVPSGAKSLLGFAKDFSGPKGPRIDVKMKNNGFPETIDVVKFIRSGLSFRLAGVDNEILSFGYIESIAYFVSDVADIIAKEFETTHVCLSGSLFGMKKLLETSAKNIQPNHKVCINRAFAIEG